MISGPRNQRLDAILIGVLFIISTSFSVAGMLVAAPYLEGPDYLAAVAANAGAMRFSALLLVIAAGVIPGMAILFYPYFRKDSTVMALSYVVLRSFEAAFYFVGILFALGLVAVAQGAVAADAADAGSFAGMAALVVALKEGAYTIGPLLIFGIGALVLSILLYRTRLVPRWLSVWALVGAVLVIAQGVLAFLGISVDVLENTLFVPIAVNEMVFAAWLIGVGFDKQALRDLFAVRG